MPALVSVIIGLALSEWEDACLEVVQASPRAGKELFCRYFYADQLFR